jgi:hypothetical protein
MFMHDSRQRETAIWSIANGRCSDDDIALLHADEQASLAVLMRLIGETEEGLDAVRHLRGDERDQVVIDFLDTLAGLRSVAERLRPGVIRPLAVEEQERDRLFNAPQPPAPLPPEPARMQASWADGALVVWAGGRGTAPETTEWLGTAFESIGAAPSGWQPHRGVQLPDGEVAESLTTSMRSALGWLVAVGVGEANDLVGPSVRWLGRVALEGVRLAAKGSMVPRVRVGNKPEGKLLEAAVQWSPVLADSPAITALAACMPNTVAALHRAEPRTIVNAVITATIEAIAAESIERMELPSAPNTANSPADLDATIFANLGGAGFRADNTLVTDLSRRLDQWAKSIVGQSRPRLVVELAPPGPDGVWLASVFAPLGKGKLAPIDTRLRVDGPGRWGLVAEWTRLGRLFPAFDRSSVHRRGRVALSQDEAWDFMTKVGPMLAAVGFDVRVPTLSRRKATASLRLFTQSTGTVVGAHQLSDVAWSVLFDDVELTADEVARLARQARPLVQSRGQWIEVDRVDLEKAAAALAERASLTQLTGAEILRQSLGLDGSGLSGGIVVQGDSWANDIVRRASAATAEPVLRPDGFVGELRNYQAEALGWIGFLEAAELGGCLALDMGLGKTPTVLAHLARSAAGGTALVIAPAAVVGNWAAEAARFAPGLKVLVHHGASRSEAQALSAQIAAADIVITTYSTAVRDIEELAEVSWGRIVLDEAQAIKNSTSETSQQLRRLPARTRIALTGTPIENGLGDLWSILDFTNPGLLGSRASFISQMSGDGEAALRALNGILLFRRTKKEPEVAAELPDKIDELDHCTMTPEQIGLYQAVLDDLLVDVDGPDAVADMKNGAVLAAITALKQICNHPAAYRDDGGPLAGRSGKLARLEEIVESVFAAGERVLVFTHFATWGRRLAAHLTEVTGTPVSCYDGSLARNVRDAMVTEFQNGTGPGALVLSLKAGGTGLNLTSANHVVLYDRWWNPAVEDQARDRAWRIGQSRTVISHRLVCPGTVDERVEEVVAGKRHIADLILPQSSSLADLSTAQLRIALGLRPDELLAEESV